MNNKSSLSAWSPRQSWGGLVVEAADKMAYLGRADLKKAGLERLSLGRIGVLSALLEAPLTQNQLCRLLRQKPPSMGELLQRLEKEKLVTSTPDDHDGRKVNWMLTVKGKYNLMKARVVFKKTGKIIDAALRKASVSKMELERSKKLLQSFIVEISKEL